MKGEASLHFKTLNTLLTIPDFLGPLSALSNRVLRSMSLQETPHSTF